MKDEKSLRTLSKMIDHSLLHPTMTDDTIRAGCELSKAYDVATACVKPYAIELARDILEGSNVDICAVVAFPHGNSTTRMKVAEAEDAAKRGAMEIDMVVNIGKVLGGDWDVVSEEIAAINASVTGYGALLKVIFENDFLKDEHIMKLCEICSKHEVAFVKTSTGYGFVKQHSGLYTYQGATDHHLRLMRQHCSEHVQIKASGGVRTLENLLRVKALGVTRIGATATQKILEDAKQQGWK
jgi:deoxyribose-phosphate aldolase